MKALLAELVDIIAEQHESEKEVIIQTEALNLVVAALLMRLDDSVRMQLKNEVMLPTY
ncbi:MAG: sigma-S stabilization anti-adapter protein IraP [Leclercia adecarboxylata]|nr:sigma-S stabilization anti-adapter protein IraP [Leclercia adecarboxylata]